MYLYYFYNDNNIFISIEAMMVAKFTIDPKISILSIGMLIFSPRNGKER